jgi:hypothetical protein
MPYHQEASGLVTWKDSYGVREYERREARNNDNASCGLALIFLVPFIPIILPFVIMYYIVIFSCLYIIGPLCDLINRKIIEPLCNIIYQKVILAYPKTTCLICMMLLVWLYYVIDRTQVNPNRFRDPRFGTPGGI